MLLPSIVDATYLITMATVCRSCGYVKSMGLHQSWSSFILKLINLNILCSTYPSLSYMLKISYQTAFKNYSKTSRW